MATAKTRISNAKLHARFVAEYLIDLNATQAYRRSHPLCTSDNVAGSKGTDS